MSGLPGTSIVACSACDSPTPLSASRAFEAGRTEHDEPSYVLTCPACVEAHYWKPLLANIAEFEPEIRDVLGANLEHVDRARRAGIATLLDAARSSPLSTTAATGAAHLH